MNSPRSCLFAVRNSRFELAVHKEYHDEEQCRGRSVCLPVKCLLITMHSMLEVNEARFEMKVVSSTPIKQYDTGKPNIPHPQACL